MAENNLYNSNICRLCAENSENGEILFTADSKETELSLMINRYLPLKVHNDGKLPRTICPGCNIQVEATVQFFDLLISGQNKIRELWKQQLKNDQKNEKESTGCNQTYIKIINNLDAAPIDKSVESSINKNESLYSEEDDILLQIKGSNKLKKKKGRPPKSSLTSKEKVKEINIEIKPDESVVEDEKLYFDEEDRRKRIRRVPQRFLESLRGKDLDNIFKKEYIFNADVKEENIDHFDTLDDENDYIEFTENLETITEENSNILLNHSKDERKIEIPNQSDDTNFQYECQFCDKTFIQRSKYLIHKSLHTLQYECKACKKVFVEKKNLTLHQQETGHTGEKIATNLSEEKNMEKAVDFKDDIIKNNANLTLNNIESNLIENDQKNILKINEDNKEDLKCPKCNKYFQNDTKLESHDKIAHQGEKPFTCEICSKAFAYKSSLIGHIELIHKDSKSNIFPCDVCGKIFNDVNLILQHKLKEHSKSNRFTCGKCKKTFKHKQLLQRHQLVHSDDRPYPCTSCNAAFKTKANLLNHQTTHTGEKKHFCELCGQQFAHKTSLTLHYRWHTGQKPYKCEFCSKSFSQNGNLQEHVRIHTGEKPYCCDHCGRKFTTSSQFKLHIKRHTGERPWKCEFCSKSFLHKDTWKCHVRRHKGEKPFQCTHCNRGFTEQWALKKHLRLHTGEKPYKCDVCNKAFADCSNLKKHTKIHKNKKVITLPKNTILQPSNSSEEAPQIIYVAYENINDGTAILQFAEDNSEGETMLGNIKEKNNFESSEIGNSNFQLHITDENGLTVPVSIENFNQAMDETTLRIQEISNTSSNANRRKKYNPILLKERNSSSASFDNFESATAIIEDEESNAAIITAENHVNNEIQLNDGQQAIEFTTQEGQKVRLVTSINVDPLQLASEYLTIV